ncbi:hypothetical protein ANRL4_00760 [Anaerolineae bacterium]|nr:hypothetical protein ANRL4_00760 [Anaerolineae bacterium]
MAPQVKKHRQKYPGFPFLLVQIPENPCGRQRDICPMMSRFTVSWTQENPLPEGNFWGRHFSFLLWY